MFTLDHERSRNLSAAPGARPGIHSHVGTDSTSCAACHNQPAIGGAGGLVANVSVLAQTLAALLIQSRLSSPTRRQARGERLGRYRDARPSNEKRWRVCTCHRDRG